MIVAWLVLACAGGTDPVPADGSAGDDSGGGGDGGGGTGAACVLDAVVEQTGSLADLELVEASGLVASRGRPGVLWSHNDSGGEARLFAFDQAGASLGRVAVEGVDFDDWEDLSVGPWEGSQGLFIGDIGDNGGTREDIVVWALPEPVQGQEQATATGLRLRYPDGAHDAEALLIDPLSGDLYVVSKQLTATSTVYRAPAPLAAEADLEAVATLDLSADQGVVLGVVTGGAVSPDGRCVYLRTYADVLAWERDPAGPLEAAFAGPLSVLTSTGEPQGEAIAADEHGYWTLSEGQGAAIHRFRRPE